MGHSYLYRCRKCGYQAYFNHGHGYLVHSQPLNEYLKQRHKLFHYKTHNLLTSLASKADDLKIKAGFEVYKCPKCKILYDKIEVSVYDNEKLVHRSEFRCKNCNSRLKKTNIHRLKSAICPVCHDKSFNIDYNQRNLWN